MVHLSGAPGVAGPLWLVWPGAPIAAFGLGRSRALLVNSCHLGGVLCEVTYAWRPGLMHVQYPGMRVAGCGSCRRVQSFAVVWWCWPALVG